MIKNLYDENLYLKSPPLAATLLGIMIELTPLIENTRILAMLHICKAIACAAAVIPDESLSCVALVMEIKATCSTSKRYK